MRMRVLMVGSWAVWVAGLVRWESKVWESWIWRVERVVKRGAQEGGLMETSRSADWRKDCRGREFVRRRSMTESCVMARGVNVEIRVARLVGWDMVSQM